MTPEMRRRRLGGRVDSVLAWGFRSLRAEISGRGVEPVLLALHPRGPEMDTSGVVPAMARAAGFPILDLTEVMGNLADSEIVSAADSHPNAAGHAVLARHLIAALARWDPARFGWADPSPAGAPSPTGVIQ
jgi:hypothetical protein